MGTVWRRTIFDLDGQLEKVETAWVQLDALELDAAREDANVELLGVQVLGRAQRQHEDVGNHGHSCVVTWRTLTNGPTNFLRTLATTFSSIATAKAL